MNELELNVDSPLEEVAAYFLKKYGPVTMQQKELEFVGQLIRLSIPDGDPLDPDAELTIELVE